jgi:hypothetical protein
MSWHDRQRRSMTNSGSLGFFRRLASLVSADRMTGGLGVVGSNPAAPTTSFVKSLAFCSLDSRAGIAAENVRTVSANLAGRALCSRKKGGRIQQGAEPLSVGIIMARI